MPEREEAGIEAAFGGGREKCLDARPVRRYEPSDSCDTPVSKKNIRRLMRVSRVRGVAACRCHVS
jgi:hypothetical protein